MIVKNVINGLELLIKDDLVEHEDLFSYGPDPEDNYSINPRDVCRMAVDSLKAYDFAWNQIKETLEELIENNDDDVKMICVFLLNLMKIKELDIKEGKYI